LADPNRRRTFKSAAFTADQKIKNDPSTAELRLFFVVWLPLLKRLCAWSSADRNDISIAAKQAESEEIRVVTSSSRQRHVIARASVGLVLLYTRLCARTETGGASPHPTRARRGLQPFTLCVKVLEKSQQHLKNPS
jgi:hypothetical protein